VRDLHAPLSGTPQLCVEAPVTEVDFYKAHDARIEETHEMAHSAMHDLRSLQPQGFTGSSFGVTHEDPSIGVYFAGWNAVEVRRDTETSRLYGN